MARSEAVHVDVRNIVIPLWLGVSITLGFCGIIGTGFAAYQSVTTKVDQLIVGQSEVWTKTDMRLWCYETERANARIGWTCPGSVQTPPKARVVRTIPVKPAAQ
jgi:hypothetical protein